MSSDQALRARVLLLIPHLGIGGAQRVTATIARNLDPLVYEAHLALLTQSTFPEGELPEKVQIHCLGAKRARYATLDLIALVCELRPRLIFIGMAHLAPLIPLLRMMLPRQTRIIIRQNGTLASMLAGIRPPSLSRLVLAAAYKLADTILCQTQSTAHAVQREFHLDQNRIRVLCNPVDIENIRQSSSCPGSRGDPYLLAAGRLVPEKGFDLLLGAMARLKADFPALRLLIAGSGPRQMALQFQSRRLGLQNHVVFLGEVRSPSHYFSNALAFVLSSRRDELPNALLEAAAGGLPIIATAASRGLTDLVRGRPGVWLAENATTDSLEGTLRRALTAIRPNQRFEHNWIQPFALAPAIAAYERIFDELLNGNPA